jgi:basic amino acid/polyamine antiporter, APA family
MFGLPVDSWLRLLGWLVVGLVIYFSYGRWHSRLAASTAAAQAAPELSEN